MGCALCYELVSGDSLRTLTCVSENESVDCLTGSLPAHLVTRRPTSTNPVLMEVSKDCEHITHSASCQAACAVGLEPTNRPEPSSLATGQLESDSVPLEPVCEEKKCVDVATSNSSMLAPDCMDLTAGDQFKVMCAAGYASTSTCTLFVVNGSVSLSGILPNCPVASSAVDGIPSGMSNCCDGITCLESFHGNRSDGYVPVDVTSAALSCGFNGFLVSNTTPFYPVCKSVSCLRSALLDDDTVEGLDRSSL